MLRQPWKCSRQSSHSGDSLLQDIFQAAREAYPEEIGTVKISEVSGLGRATLCRTLRNLYRRYEKHPERYPITVRKVAKHEGGWRVKWRPEHAGMHGN